jgi:hypothetical protein
MNLPDIFGNLRSDSLLLFLSLRSLLQHPSRRQYSSRNDPRHFLKKHRPSHRRVRRSVPPPTNTSNPKNTNHLKRFKSPKLYSTSTTMPRPAGEKAVLSFTSARRLSPTLRHPRPAPSRPETLRKLQSWNLLGGPLPIRPETLRKLQSWTLWRVDSVGGI